MHSPLVFGCTDPWHDSNYAFWDGKRIHHIEVERYTRSKYDVTSPLLVAASRHPDALSNCDILAIEEGLFLAPAIREIIAKSITDVDVFVDKTSNIWAKPSIPNQILLSPQSTECLDRLIRRIQDGSINVEFYNHHFCHAVNAYACSMLSEALSVSLDGGGAHLLANGRTEVHGSVYHFSDRIPVSDSPLELVTDWSPGWAWTRASRLLSFGAHEAGTVMAMAAYGTRDENLQRLASSDELWYVNEPDLSVECIDRLRRLTSEISNRLVNDELRYSFALELQIETERRIRSFLQRYLAAEEVQNLCLSGGTFLNCIVAGKVKQWFPSLNNVFIPPAPYDSGISVGMVQAHLWKSGQRSSAANNNGCLLTAFSSTTVFNEIDIYGACRALFRRDPDVLGVDHVAALLGEGCIIAIFQGGSEIGRRALGNRSIVCDPRNGEHKITLNSIIKHRQWFRPFAPMIKAENVQDWFDVDSSFMSPYMSFAVHFRDGKADLVPAVAHADGTARVQTVHKELTPSTHQLLCEWEVRSGVPILLNTSFNDREPIVETPYEALSTFASARIDGIYFADYRLFLDRSSLQR